MALLESVPPFGPLAEEVHTLADSLLPSRQDPVALLFNDAGFEPPTLTWSPTRSALRHPLLKRFYDVVEKQERQNQCLLAETITEDLLGLHDLGNWFIYLEAETPEGPFRYRSYGQAVAQTYGHDMTGKTTLDFPEHIGVFFSALYYACAMRREPVLAIHEPPNEVFVQFWHRLTVPVCATKSIGKIESPITGFLTLAIPESDLRAGMELMPDPVMVADAEGIVRFANRKAREAFDGGCSGPWDRTVFDYSGLDLTLDQSPEDLIRRDMIDERRVLRLDQTTLRDVRVTVSAARHRGAALYVIVIRID
ncbi:MAG: PAS domain-containing protein [Pseudomonadota bacterium]